MSRAQRKPRAKLDLAELRAEVKAVHEQGLRIQSHYRKLEQEYSDWEDRLNKLDAAINNAENELGLNKAQVLQEPTPFGDLPMFEDDNEKSLLEELGYDS